MSGMMIPRPEQLVDIASHVAAVKLAMEGAFDDRIAALQAEQNALSEKTGIVSTLEKAQTIRKDAEDYAAKTRSLADAAVTKAQGMVDKIAAREAAVAAREGAVSSREATVEQRQSAQDARETALQSAADAFERRKSDFESARKQTETNLAARQAKLDADTRAFNQKLESLKV